MHDPTSTQAMDSRPALSGPGAIFLALMVFVPIPLGLGRTEINILLAAIAVLGTLLFGFVPKPKQLIFYAWAVIYLLTTTLVDTIENQQWGGVEPFQIVRLSAFPAISLLVFSWGDRRILLYKILEKYWFPALALVCVQIPLAYLLPQYANIPLGGGESAALEGGTPRLYIHPYPLVYAVLPLLIITGKYRAAAAATLLLAATGSRQVFVYILIIWISATFDVSKPFRSLIGPIAVLIAIALALATGLSERFDSIYREGGDFVRAQEISAAFERWNENTFSRLFGIGAGTRYWEGWDYVLRSFDAEASLINSGYDVHNGLMALLLRFGIVGCAILAVAIFKLHDGIQFKLKALMLSGIFLSLSSSSAFYMNDLLMYSLAVGYVRWTVDHSAPR